jgi:hypothetical protein
MAQSFANRQDDQIVTKMGWGAFWTTFSETHLVALFAKEKWQGKAQNRHKNQREANTLPPPTAIWLVLMMPINLF